MGGGSAQDASAGEQAAQVKARPASRRRWRAIVRNIGRDAIAGFVAAIVLVANIVSFAALMFPGELASGIPIAIWAMLVGSAVGGVWIAWWTSLPPLATGIDSPTGAFLVLLSAATASAVGASGGSVDAIVVSVMIVFTAATFMSGGLLFVIGALRWGGYFRFIPYFVVAGFLLATGGFLIAGGVRMATGMPFAIDRVAELASGAALVRLASALVVLAVLLGIRRLGRSPVAMPVALLVMWLVGVVLLHASGAAAGKGWYLPSMGTLRPWLPFEALGTAHFSWSMVVRLVPEFVAVSLVALMSLVTKVASIEVARQAAGNLDREFRAHGAANLAIVPLGGIACSLQTGTSELLRKAGGASRASGVMASLVLGAVALVNLDLPALIPIPIVAGLVLYLGYTFCVDALRNMAARRAWTDCCSRCSSASYVCSGAISWACSPGWSARACCLP